jgi:hypothetical protein
LKKVVWKIKCLEKVMRKLFGANLLEFDRHSRHRNGLPNNVASRVTRWVREKKAPKMHLKAFLAQNQHITCTMENISAILKKLTNNWVGRLLVG